MLKGKIFIERNSLNLKMMLTGGQSFRWKEISHYQWIGTMCSRVWLLSQYDDHITYEIKGSLTSIKSIKGSTNEEHEIIKEYLRINAPLSKYYNEWSAKDPNFCKVAQKCYGIRILNQEPVENIFSFICSSNNNIKRISNLVEKLCKMYGKKICEFEGFTYYSFPDLSDLVKAKEEDLRKSGFGYRAKFIHNAARQIEEFGGLLWIKKLKESSYIEAKKELMKLSGIGAKVADCICLMSLGHMEALPVDTHVYQIACECYLPHLRKVKNVTDRVYNEIGDYFRNLYGPLAGWAHTILFCGDLKAFKEPDPNSAELLSSPLLNEKKITKKKRSISIDHYTVSGDLKCPRNDLNLLITLNSGQTYRFKQLEQNIWRGVFSNKVWTLHQFEDHIKFTTHFNRLNKQIKSSDKGFIGEVEDCLQILNDYFRLDVPLSKYYEKWSSSDNHFKEISEKFCGLRMIKQDIVENIFAFICSSCNTIDRMTTMVETMCNLYGEKIAEVDGVVYNSFPSVERLSNKKVAYDLSKANFGYRAKYIQQAADYIVKKGGNVWFEKLKLLPYEEAKAMLMKLPGIAAKVADCICLTALDHLEAIPVDTHVFQIAKLHYLPHLKEQKTISTKAYSEIGKCFRSTFGQYSGWAHTVLFCADLKRHKSLHS